MSKPRQAEAVKLVMSIITSRGGILPEAMQILTANFGRPDLISAEMPFDYTNYYEIDDSY